MQASFGEGPGEGPANDRGLDLYADDGKVMQGIRGHSTI